MRSQLFNAEVFVEDILIAYTFIAHTFAEKHGFGCPQTFSLRAPHQRNWTKNLGQKPWDKNHGIKTMPKSAGRLGND